MNKMIEGIKRDVKNNPAKKITSAMAISVAINPSMLGITCHKKHIPIPSFDSILQDLNEYYLDNDFSNHVKVRNENLEYSEDGYESYAYLEVKDLGIVIKATIAFGFCSKYLSFEIDSVYSRKVIGTLDDAKYQYKDFSVVPIEKHIYDMLFHFTMDYYNLYSDDYDE